MFVDLEVDQRVSIDVLMLNRRLETHVGNVACCTAAAVSITDGNSHHVIPWSIVMEVRLHVPPVSSSTLPSEPLRQHRT